MNSVQYSALARLLSHNSRIHELEDTLRGMAMPQQAMPAADAGLYLEGITGPIADLQDEIDQEVRASLVTCWLGMPGELEDWDQV